MLVQAADVGITIQDAPTTIGLQPVLVRINDDRIDVGQSCIRLLRIGIQVAGKSKIATVRGICVNSEIELFA